MGVVPHTTFPQIVIVQPFAGIQPGIENVGYISCEEVFNKEYAAHAVLKGKLERDGESEQEARPLATRMRTRSDAVGLIIPTARA